VRKAIEQGSTEELDEVIRIVRQTGALDATRAAAHAEARRAMAAAEALPGNSYSGGLIELAAQLLTRRT
jgi:octaprenyl-diphosphate synthase